MRTRGGGAEFDGALLPRKAHVNKPRQHAEEEHKDKGGLSPYDDGPEVPQQFDASTVERKEHGGGDELNE